MTKNIQKGAVTTKNNIPSYDEICHKMAQSTFRDGGQKAQILELIDALRKIGYFQSFQVTDNNTFSEDKRQKRRLKPKKHAEYRLIKRYYKSRKQYVKERTRRKLCWLLSGKYKESEIAEMLGISRRTVIRDMNKIKPYYFRLSRAYFRELHEEKRRRFEALLVGLTAVQKLNVLSDLIVEARKERLKQRQYRGHYAIFHLDLTQTDKYGIPKLTLLPRQTRNTRLAYPYKIRVHIKGSYEGRTFEADIGGLRITQTTTRGW